MKKQWKLDNKGMTLLEVIVAFAIFAIAATILITGFNGALKVMGNSEAIKNASQGNASGLDVYGTTFEQMEGLKDLTQITKDENTVLTFNGYKIFGTLITATTAKTNDQTEMSLKMFEPDTEVLVTPTVPEPNKKPEPEPEKYDKWEGPWPKNYVADANENKYSKVEYNGLYYQCVLTHTVYAAEQEATYNPAVATNLWHRTNDPDGTPLVWDVSTYYALNAIVSYNNNLYQCTLARNNHGNQPDVWTQYWKKIKSE